MSGLSKMRVEGTRISTVVLWEGDQIAFAVNDDDPPMLCVTLSEEDFENGELAATKRAELRAARTDIVAELRRRGFSFE